MATTVPTIPLTSLLILLASVMLVLWAHLSGSLIIKEGPYSVVRILG